MVVSVSGAIVSSTVKAVAGARNSYGSTFRGCGSLPDAISRKTFDTSALRMNPAAAHSMIGSGGSLAI